MRRSVLFRGPTYGLGLGDRFLGRERTDHSSHSRQAVVFRDTAPFCLDEASQGTAYSVEETARRGVESGFVLLDSAR